MSVAYFILDMHFSLYSLATLSCEFLIIEND